MKFYLVRHERLLDNDPASAGIAVSAATSVVRYRRDFLSALARFGEIRFFDDTMPRARLAAMLAAPGAVLVSVNVLSRRDDWHCIAHRYLELSLGRLMMPAYLLTCRRLARSQVTLVSTEEQRRMMRAVFGTSAPRCEVYAPAIDRATFRAPAREERLAARRRFGCADDARHVVYAGRLIPSKGVVQLIRACARCATPLALTLAGTWDAGTEFGLTRRPAQGFRALVRQAVAATRVRVRLIDALAGDDLRQLFWSADAAANLSVHPDENFGIVSREAAACGTRTVTTDFGGLRQCASFVPWGGVRTYPTFAGARFSVAQAAGVLRQALHGPVSRAMPPCVPGGLARAVAYLRVAPAERMLAQERTVSAMRGKLLSHAPPQLLRTDLAWRRQPPQGGHAHHDAATHPDNYLVTALFTGAPVAPRVKAGTRYEGFFSLQVRTRALVEHGCPAPRCKQYPAKAWQALRGCQETAGGAVAFTPRTRYACALVQELVDLGYLVPSDDDYAGNDL